jgi:hypothetical protein
MSASESLVFDSRKCTIAIDYSRCLPAREGTSEPACGFACVKSCRLMGRNILKIENNRPVLAVTDPEEIKRLDNECLSCEYNCSVHGPGCIEISVHMD